MVTLSPPRLSASGMFVEILDVARKYFKDDEETPQCFRLQKWNGRGSFEAVEACLPFMEV